MFPLPSALLIKIGAALALCGVMYFMGYSHEHKRFVKYQAEVAALGKAQEVLNKSAVKLAEVISSGVKDEYETRIAGLHAKYANVGRVCQPNANSSNLSVLPNSAQRAYDPTVDPELIVNCAATTAQLVSLQKWVDKQIEAQK